jgi:hypothetical protein
LYPTRRDAGPTIAGFFLQVNVSILRWLDIDASQYLELECGEALRTECVAAHGKSQYLTSYMLMLGELIRSSAHQSLYLQVKMMETLGRVFSGEMPIYKNMVAPFFVKFWKAQAEKSLHPFRTAHSYTTRQFEMSDGTVAGTRKLLSAMRFCLGVSLPEDAMSWLASS